MDFGDPRGAIIGAFTILRSISLGLFVVALFAVVMRTRYAPGTRGRYVFSTFYRPLALFQPVFWLLSLLIDALDLAKWHWYLIDVAMLALSVWQYYMNRTDDDDFWKGLPGRIKAGLRRRSSLRVAPAHR